MTSFFPDVNVWLALSVAGHRHSVESWNWLNLLSRETRIIFSRYTQVGLLRLLTHQSVMGDQTLTVRKAWTVYDRWINDPRVEMYPEPRGIDVAFREATAPFSKRPASKWIGDCYLLAYAKQNHAVLATFDQALYELAGKHGYAAVVPA